MGFVLVDKTLAVEQAAARYSDLPPSYEEAISTSYYDSPPSYEEAISTSHYDSPPSYEEAVSTSYYAPPPSYEEAMNTSYYNPTPSYEKPSPPSYDWPTIHYEAPTVPSYYDQSKYEEMTFPSYYEYQLNYEEPTYTTNYGGYSGHDNKPYAYYQLLSGALGYRKANCGRADDWSSHHICCSEPGASENSVWAAAPGRDWQCIDQPRSNCESNTRIWDNSKKVLTQNTMPAYCKARGKGAVLFDGRPPPISKRVIDL